ncbi:MAG: rRNA maturation RNase YbeY [Bacilli bacterium]
MENVEIFNETKEDLKDLEILKPLLEYARKKEKLEDTELEFSVIIVDNKRIHEINKEYRGIDRPTDVISFALEDNEEIKFDNYRVLGDIYISIDKVREQAKEYGHSEKRELAFLTVHGFLHLLGYDHMKPEEEKIMFAKQEEILDGFGIKR